MRCRSSTSTGPTCRPPACPRTTPSPPPPPARTPGSSYPASSKRINDSASKRINDPASKRINDHRTRGRCVSDLIERTAADLAGAIASRELTAVEVTQAHLDRIAAVDGSVHAFLHVDSEGALAQAERVDRGEITGPLAGVPLALKDIIVTRGVPTTAGSKILQGWIPPYQATIVERMLAAGIVIIGKTNCDEFAMGSSTEHSAYGA